MKQWLFNLAAGVSLLLCVASTAFWVRSRSTVDQVILSTPYHETSLVSGEGSLRLIYADLDYATPQYMLDNGGPIPRPLSGWSTRWETDCADSLFERIIRNDPTPWAPVLLPVRLERGAPSNRFSESPPFWGGTQVTVPYYVLSLAAAVAPAVLVLVNWRSRVKLAKGLCPVCGYDLRATPERCPECGAVPRPKAEAAK